MSPLARPVSPAAPSVQSPSTEEAARPSRLALLWERGSIGIVFVLFVVMRAADRVLIKRVSNALPVSYNVVLMNIIWPLAVQMLVAMMMIGYVFYMRRQGHSEYTWRFLLPGNPAASTTGAVPLYYFAFMSLGDQVGAAIQTPPTPFLSQTMQSLISNTNVLWTAVFAFIFLGTRFKQVHYIGCALVVLSVLVAFSPGIENNDCSPSGLQKNHCLNSYKGDDHQFHLLGMGVFILWLSLYSVGVIPQSAGNVYKQWVLQGRDVDVMYATWWSGNFQVLWGWLCVPMIWIKLPGQDVAPGETFQVLYNTFSCLLGNVPVPGQDDTCAAPHPSPMFWFGCYLLFNMLYNLLFLWLTKRMSATWTTIATVLCLDLTNIFGMIPFIAGGGATIMGLSDWLGTALSSLALWVYSIEPEVTPGDKESSLDAENNKADDCEIGSEDAHGEVFHV